MRITVPALAALTVLAVGGCSGDGGFALSYRCTMADADGLEYVGKDIDPMAALEVARSDCALGARDPTSCRRVDCVPE